MRQQNKQAIFFGMMTIGLYLFAWIVQDLLFLNGNVGYLLNASRLLLTGGSYTKDFFTPNPPMILFLYLPPVIVSKLLSFNIILDFRFYIILLCTLSLALCWPSVRKIFANDLLLARLFMFVLAGVFLLAPVYDFGDRDHLFLVLTMPYLLLAADKLINDGTSEYHAVVTGILAGVGAAIKPQFLLTPVLIECFYICWKNKWNAWSRTETAALAGVLLLYALIVLTFFQDYVKIILPYHLRNYYGAASESWTVMTLSPLTVFCLLAFPFYFSLYKKNNYLALSSILLVGLAGFLISYYLQHSLSYCHLIPALSLAMLIFLLLFYQLTQLSQLTINEYISLAFIMLAFLLANYYLSYNEWINLVFFPGVFYGFFGVLLCVLMYVAQQDKNIGKVIAAVFLIMIACYVFTQIMLPSILHLHGYMLAFVLLVLLYAGCIWRIRGRLMPHGFVAALAMLVFFVPAVQGFYRFNEGINYRNKTLNNLVEFMQTQPAHKTFYVLSSKSSYSFPLVYYTSAVSVQRFDRLWMVSGLFSRRYSSAASRYPQFGKDRKFIIDMVVDDLHRSKPDLIFVDMSDINFNYLTYFIGDQNFRDEWKSYEYLTTIKQNSLALANELQVYKRRNTPSWG